MNVDLEQTKNNIHYKTCNTTYNERLKELVNEGNEILNNKGKPVLIKSYSLLQDRFYKYMSDNGYKDFIRGVKGSTAEHLSDIEFKAKKEREKKIVIHQQEKVNGNKVQEIDIYYRGVGIISFPVSHEDIEITINKILNRKIA